MIEDGSGEEMDLWKWHVCLVSFLIVHYHNPNGTA